MKTLDEVIKSFEWCIDDSHDDCDGCPYDTGEATDCHDRNVDALHYLKAFRDAKNALDAERERTIEAYYQWKDAKEKLEAQTSQMMWVDKHFQFEISDNSPLDWETLKQMEGKPVWVEQTFTHKRYSGWVINKGTDDLAMIADSRSFDKSTYEKTWRAYRKEHGTDS